MFVLRTWVFLIVLFQAHEISRMISLEMCVESGVTLCGWGMSNNHPHMLTC